MTPEQIIANSIPEPNTGCFLWLGRVSKAGYGRLKGRVGQYTHRIVCECPDDSWALHSCDQPSCVNPDHLRHGTNADNVADKMKRGRHSNGRRERTHCGRGHPLSGENLYVWRGQRHCRACRPIRRGE